MPTAPKMYSTVVSRKIWKLKSADVSMREAKAWVRFEIATPNSTNATSPAPIIRRSIRTAAYIDPAPPSSAADSRKPGDTTAVGPSSIGARMNHAATAAAQRQRANGMNFVRR